MNGLVIWSGIKGRIGLVWCEDHGPLAVFQLSRELFASEDLPEQGDLVHLRFSAFACDQRGFRRLEAVSIVEKGGNQAAAEVSQSLASGFNASVYKLKS